MLWIVKATVHQGPGQSLQRANAGNAADPTQVGDALKGIDPEEENAAGEEE